MNKELAKFLARLTALKNNLPKSLSTEERYVHEYHAILDGLAGETGEDLSEFRVPDSDVYTDTESGERFHNRPFLMAKLDAILGYFTLLLQPTEIRNQMGFSVEEND